MVIELILLTHRFICYVIYFILFCLLSSRERHSGMHWNLGHPLLSAADDLYAAIFVIHLLQSGIGIWASRYISNGTFEVYIINAEWEIIIVKWVTFDCVLLFLCRSGGARGPGVFFVLPCIDNYCKVDLRTVSFDVPPQEVLSKDSVTVSVDAVVYYRISDPLRAVIQVWMNQKPAPGEFGVESRSMR